MLSALLRDLLLVGSGSYFLLAQADLAVSAILPNGQVEVTVESDPPGADVIWENKVRGQTPFKLPLPIGKQELVLRYKTLKDQKRTIEVESNGQNPPKVTFPYATLFVTSDPSGAQVFLRTNLVGVTPTSLVVDPGPIDLKFELNDLRASLKTNAVLGQEILLTVPLAVPVTVMPKPEVQTMTNSLNMIFLNVSEDLWVSQSEVTVKEYNEVQVQEDKIPENQKEASVTWNDAMEFCGKLTEKEYREKRIDSKKYLYSLPETSDWRNILLATKVAAVLRLGSGDQPGTAKNLEWCFTSSARMAKKAPLISLRYDTKKPLETTGSTFADDAGPPYPFRCVLVLRSSRPNPK